MKIHLDYIVKKTWPMIFTLAKVRTYIEEYTAVLMYKSYIQPVLETGLFTLNHKNKRQMSHLQTLQTEL